MTIRQLALRRLAVLLAVAVTAALLAAPAAAAPGGLAPPDDDTPTHGTDDTSDASNGESVGPGGLAEPEPVARTGAATYTMTVATPDGTAPDGLVASTGADDVEAVAATLEDGAFLAVLIIDDADDPPSSASTVVMGFTAWFVDELAPWLALPACVALATSGTLRLRARRLRDAARSGG